MDILMQFRGKLNIAIEPLIYRQYCSQVHSKTDLKCIAEMMRPAEVFFHRDFNRLSGTKYEKFTA